MAGIGKGKAGPGRPKGLPNKVTRAAKEAFAYAFEELGGADRMVKWANTDPENLKTFYTLYARLIPVDLTTGEASLHITREVITGA